MTTRRILALGALAAGLLIGCGDDETTNPTGSGGSGGGSGGSGGMAGSGGRTAGMGGMGGIGGCGFGEVMEVQEVNSTLSEYGPSISSDGLSLYFTSDRLGTTGPADVWVATRASINDPFGVPTNVTEVNSADEDSVPDVASDGLTLYLGSTRAGSAGSVDVWVATRASTSDPFGAPTNVAELDTADWDSAPSITADGLTIFIMSDRPGGAGGQDIWMATRASTSDPFGAPTNVAEVNSADMEASPSVSPDGLALLFNSDRAGGEGGQDIWMAMRASTSDPFGAPVNVAAVNTNANEQGPDITDDGQTIYFNRTVASADIFVATCP